ncbi:MFS general substrate transporter [Stereum hirsutum FP-91666 SS1]|uniref:MFS general substrate transporter n=1 Tax=Stereum hirsutum (strain FP-91666) TaxID=721885 RepID=UPI000440E25D|nr:MFS general substrate transporter [Stereum hirsutum FP-91666 SS1]EIM90956.1 MFS general substrate transporter [Stereum hirsutum FP-91666 SS1]
MTTGQDSSESVKTAGSGGSISPDFAHGEPLDGAFARRVVRKIDKVMMPLMFITYCLNFADKTVLSSASVFGLSTDTGLVGQQYSWISSVFYFGYLMWTYPTTLLIQKLPVGTYISINTILWGLIVALTAACTNFGGLMAVRFLLGVAEATITPAFVYVTAMWYTREEIPVRTGIWFAGNSFGGFATSLIAYGVGHIERPLTAWQWLFIIFGVATGLWGIAMLFTLPDSISSCKFLTEEEKQYATERVAVAGTGNVKAPKASEWKAEQAIECLLDVKTWFFVAISICTQIPNSGTNNFANLVITGFGFTDLQSTLVGIPSSFISFFSILITGYIAGHRRNASALLLIAVVIPPVVGSAIIYKDLSNGVKLFAYYIISTGPAALPLAMSLMSSNYRGVTKKMTMTALMFLCYCAGNIAGPHFFLTAEKPHYPTAFRTIMICYALVVVEALGLRYYLAYENRRRDMVEGASGRVPATVSSDEDLTDKQTVGMRYRL